MIMMEAGLIPTLGGGKGEAFLKAYKEIYEQRIKAKRRAGDLKREISEIKRQLQNG